MTEREQAIAARAIYSSLNPRRKLWQYLTGREQYLYLAAAKEAFDALQKDTA